MIEGLVMLWMAVQDFLDSDEDYIDEYDRGDMDLDEEDDF